MQVRDALAVELPPQHQIEQEGRRGPLRAARVPSQSRAGAKIGVAGGWRPAQGPLILVPHWSMSQPATGVLQFSALSSSSVLLASKCLFEIIIKSTREYHHPSPFICAFQPRPVSCTCSQATTVLLARLSTPRSASPRPPSSAPIHQSPQSTRYHPAASQTLASAP